MFLNLISTNHAQKSWIRRTFIGWNGTKGEGLQKWSGMGITNSKQLSKWCTCWDFTILRTLRSLLDSLHQTTFPEQQLLNSKQLKTLFFFFLLFHFFYFLWNLFSIFFSFHFFYFLPLKRNNNYKCYSPTLILLSQSSNSHFQASTINSNHHWDWKEQRAQQKQSQIFFKFSQFILFLLR